MQNRTLLVVLSLIISLNVSGKGHGGHGGGHGGHGGGHSAGHSHGSVGHHSAARSVAHRPAQHHRPTSGRVSGNSRGARTTAAARPVYGMRMPVARARIAQPTFTGRTVLPERGIATPYGYYPRGYDPYYYAFTPYYTYPYYNMWSVGTLFTFTPNYGYGPANPAYYNENPGPGPGTGASGLPENGYAVFARDTIKGVVTLHPKKVSVDAEDSGKKYDYSFKIKNHELTCVTLYNEDNKELDLVRLGVSQKKLWRVVHTGKLNLYDNRLDFIYSPSDIAVDNLVVSYNGATYPLVSAHPDEAKTWLTAFVNRAYGKTLRPGDFSWNELLVYLDKLD